MPRVKGAKDTITQPLYDSGAVTATATKLTFFQTPVGSGASVWNAAGGKTLEDTNMVQGGQLPNPWEFEIFTVQLQFAPDAKIVDLAKILKGGALELTIGAKQWLQVPITFLPSGCGLYGFTTTAATDVASSGTPNPKEVFTLAPQTLTIESQENFAATITWGTAPAPAATVNCRLYLHGMLTRGVQ